MPMSDDFSNRLIPLLPELEWEGMDNRMAPD